MHIWKILRMSSDLTMVMTDVQKSYSQWSHQQGLGWEFNRQAQLLLKDLVNPMETAGSACKDYLFDSHTGDVFGHNVCHPLQGWPGYV